jgi:hypothetical protein
MFPVICGVFYEPVFNCIIIIIIIIIAVFPFRRITWGVFWFLLRSTMWVVTRGCILSYAHLRLCWTVVACSFSSVVVVVLVGRSHGFLVNCCVPIVPWAGIVVMDVGGGTSLIGDLWSFGTRLSGRDWLLCAFILFSISCVAGVSGANFFCTCSAGV